MGEAAVLQPAGRLAALEEGRMPLRRALSLRENLPVRCRPVGAWVSLRVRARLQQG